jgi:phage FluMu gp28-like protein
MTPEMAQTMPPVLAGAKSIPAVLINYQRKLLASTSTYALTVCEKSRRIGATWAVAADAVLTSASQRVAGGMDTFYIGYEKEMTREFIDTCAMWAKSFDQVAEDVEEFIFEDRVSEADVRQIQAFRIRFASGFDIVALSSRPRSLRGRQGYVIIDEAAFHDNLAELLKAAMALLIWGGKVLVISTHDGVGNAFNSLVEDVKTGAQPGNLVRITFEDAIADGLYKRICLVRGIEWTAEAEEKWIAEIRGIYRANASEELDVIPKNTGGAYLPRALIEARMSDEIPVLRWTVPADFVNHPMAYTQAEAMRWCEQNLKPLLDKLDPRIMHAFGQDFGRHGDLSVMWPLAIARDLVRVTPFIVELRRVPFEEQKLIATYIIDRLPKFQFGAIDATGNGASQAEALRRKYSEQRIEEVKLSQEWYRVNMPLFKGAFEGASILIPKDLDVRTDLEALSMENGIAKVPNNARSEGSDGEPRHGDSAIAGALAWYASTKQPTKMEFQSTGQTRIARDVSGGWMGSMRNVR